VRPSQTNLRTFVIGLLLLGLTLFVFTRHQVIEERHSLRWIERPILWITTPLAQGILSVRTSIRQTFQRYLALVGVEKDNEQLRQEVEKMKGKTLFLQDLERENGRLRELLTIQPRLPGEWVAARVVAYPPIAPHRILTIDKGENQGIRRRAPVVVGAGLVGEIARVEGNRSQVLLVTDPTNAVDARIEPSGERGLIVGKVVKLGLKRDLFLSAFEYLSRAIEIQEGSTVMTSGLDGIYPGGILIGSIQTGKKKKYDIFQQAEVVPAVDFYKLREVLVLKK